MALSKILNLHPEIKPKMSKHRDAERPGILNLLQSKCPRCRIGDMFEKKNPYSKGFMKMNERCEVCGQYFDLEVGFYYGSGYVSYGVGVAISVATFIAWWVIIGISYDDNRVLYWLIFNSILIIALQPWLMRLSRTIWLALFVKYDREWRSHPAKAPERINNEQKNNW
jgi:uncharacterized protein (DUF983 family)